MPMDNAQIAAILNKVADLLDIGSENPFRIRAYRNAARIVGGLGHSIQEMLAQGQDLTQLPGIGRDLAGKIGEIAATGTLSQLKELEKGVPPDLYRLMKMGGLGPRRVKALHDALGITDLEELRRAAQAEKIRALPGFGAKTEASILDQIDRVGLAEERTKYIQAEQIAGDLTAYLESFGQARRIEVAGSFRRRSETVGDLDILTICPPGTGIMEHFIRFDQVDEILSKGPTRSSVLLRTGIQVDLRVLPEAGYGAGLHYFTGSRSHNIAVRKLAVQRKLKISEYGVFQNGSRIAGRTEAEVFGTVWLPYIEPELRENRGEIEAAKDNRLPRLVKLEDIRGDLHSHTHHTDGHQSLGDMAAAARERGYGYLAITNHSKRVSMAHGLDARRLAGLIAEIDRLNQSFKDFYLLKGIEVDILEDGSLDLPDSILKELDVVIASVHYYTKLSREKQTERVIRAMDNPLVHILAHPTGRLINKRPPYEIDMARVMNAALKRGCHLELNAHPDRLDLNDIHCRMARDLGIRVAISTDAHSTSDLDFMRFGIYQARRGWLEGPDVLNTLPLDELLKQLRR